jgi:hypothetical protein
MPPPAQNEVKLSKNQRKKLNAAKRKEQAGKENSGKQKSFYKQHIKPDLRKRTWDKVDAGMDSLAYDDEPSNATPAAQASQRRRISYDD